MRWAALGAGSIGATVANAIFTEKGGVLVNAGTVLTPAYIRSLQKRGIDRIVVTDEQTTDILIHDVVSDATRASATASVGRIYEQLVAIATGLGHGDPSQAAKLVESEAMRQAASKVPIEEIYQAADAIVLDTYSSTVDISSLTYFKSVENYGYSHAVDAAIIAVLIGYRLRMTQAELKRLARGCLLRDLGNIFMPTAGTAIPTGLAEDDPSQLLDHPTLGYQLLRAINPGDFVANHIAYQHHERQDGKGYPRHLRSTNRLARDMQGQGYMVLHAEIAAVADVYDALVSDRPHRSALSPEAAALYLQRLGGSHLNREVIQTFLSILPVYPLGVEVEITAGRRLGCHGVVAKINRYQLDRPVIRILSDAAGEPVDPSDVDLRHYPDMVVATTSVELQLEAPLPELALAAS